MVKVAIFQARQRNGGDLFEWLFALRKGQKRHQHSQGAYSEHFALHNGVSIRMLAAEL
jgi:hypothetical protein